MGTLDASVRRVTSDTVWGPSPAPRSALRAERGLPPSVRSVPDRDPDGVAPRVLDKLVEEIADVRPLPPIAAQVLQIAEGQHFSAHELAQAISSDPALTARVLRLANSAYYGFPRRITTVRDAVVLLGYRQIRAVALAACAMRAMPSEETICPEPFWRHAVTVGLLAELLARDTGRHQDSAFTAGVLHNIGRLALDQVRPTLFAHVGRQAAQSGRTVHESERELLGFTDAELGGALALHWQFPPDLALAIARHAEPVDSMCDPNGLAALVARARLAAAARGVTDGVDEPPARVMLSPAYRATLVAMSPDDRAESDPDWRLPRFVRADEPTSAGTGRDAVRADRIELLIGAQGGFEAIEQRAAAFVEHAGAA